VRQYRPVPTARPAYGSELEALQAKEKGPWSELTKQEKIDLRVNCSSYLANSNDSRRPYLPPGIKRTGE